ncbi:hypothetical protein H6P81_016429 [Aristolochia fimbriata]|uniref:Uncharacterized protein n=1 Tax=Aristolochia fimbriata TaxID=158543 RepID=A0AAV7E9Z0_ARIFI|nr:hypothetical protein H6P81_016429 [Aristolochia fimbriata]
MCPEASTFHDSAPPRNPCFRRRGSKLRPKLRIQIHRAPSKVEERPGREMELQNMKLYLENRMIFEENERLRRKALLLGEENRALLTQLRKKLNFHDEPRKKLN